MAISLLEQNQNEDENKREISSLPSLGGDRTSSFSTGLNQPSSQKGSGRFTNLTKYVQANQGAGDTIAERMAQRSQRDVDAFKSEQDKGVQEVGSKITEAQNLFGTTGSQFKNQLGQFNQGYQGVSAFTQPFEQTGEQIQSFTKSPDFSKFQQLRTGQGLDESFLNQQQSGLEFAAQNALDTSGKRFRDIQTEQGRYDLLRGLQPIRSGYTTGQGRLDQLMFQASPSSVSNLQQRFSDQQADVLAKKSALDAQKQAISDIVGQESALSQDLTSSAKGLNDLFKSRLESSIPEVQAARDKLYKNYLDQLSSGSISKDLSGLLGLEGLQTWNPSLFTEGVTVNPDRIRTYRSLDNPSAPASYISAGDKIQGFQDLLTEPNYSTYQALGQLIDTPSYEMAGPSNIGQAVVATQGPQSLAEQIKLQDTGVRNLETNPLSESWSYPDAGLSGSYSWSLPDYMRWENAATPQEKRDIALGTIKGLDQYVTGPRDKRLDAAIEAVNRLSSNLGQEVSGRGVRNTATLTRDDTKEQEEFKRFKGLL